MEFINVKVIDHYRECFFEDTIKKVQKHTRTALASLKFSGSTRIALQ